MSKKRTLELDSEFKSSASNERIDMRVSAQEKKEIIESARELGCGMTAYLLRLHRFVNRR